MTRQELRVARAHFTVGAGGYLAMSVRQYATVLALILERPVTEDEARWFVQEVNRVES